LPQGPAHHTVHGGHDATTTRMGSLQFDAHDPHDDDATITSAPRRSYETHGDARANTNAHAVDDVPEWAAVPGAPPGQRGRRDRKAQSRGSGTRGATEKKLEAARKWGLTSPPRAR